MTEKQGFVPEDSERDKIVAEALSRGKAEDAGGEYVPSKSAEEIRKMQEDAKHDRSVLETLGKIRRPRQGSEKKDLPKSVWKDGDGQDDMWGVSKDVQEKLKEGEPLSPGELQEIQDFENRNK